jgi:hypothetical protein
VQVIPVERQLKGFPLSRLTWGTNSPIAAMNSIKAGSIDHFFLNGTKSGSINIIPLV